MASSDQLPALQSKPKYIFLTDFDGTITLQDSNDFMTDNIGFGKERREQGNADVLLGKRDFRDSFKDMMDSISTPYNECVDLLLKNVELDPYFREFFLYAQANNIPIVILSGGMQPIIKALLTHLLGEEEVKQIQIVSNDVKARPGKDLNEERGWEIVYHDDSGFGHDKSIEIRKYSQLPDSVRPGIFYAGDGVSDLSAAKEGDIMFAKAGRDLVLYCEREKVPFTTFNDFSDILSVVKDVVSGKVSIKDAATGRA